MLFEHDLHMDDACRLGSASGHGSFARMLGGRGLCDTALLRNISQRQKCKPEGITLYWICYAGNIFIVISTKYGVYAWGGAHGIWSPSCFLNRVLAGKNGWVGLGYL